MALCERCEQAVMDVSPDGRGPNLGVLLREVLCDNCRQKVQRAMGVLDSAPFDLTPPKNGPVT